MTASRIPVTLPDRLTSFAAVNSGRAGRIQAVRATRALILDVFSKSLMIGSNPIDFSERF